MASETTASSNPPAAGATTLAPLAPPPSISLPDPFGVDPFQASTDAGAASAFPTDSSPSLPDPFASDPFQTPASGAAPLASPANGSPPPPSPLLASGGTGTPQTGVWFNDPDPQYLIQWSLQEVQEPQLSAPSASQAAPSTTYKARARIFQEVFETTLATARPVVPFSLRDANTGSLCLQGSLVLLQQPSDPPVLLVKNLKFSGFQQAQVVLFPSAPDKQGGGSGG
ncbi:MAG TPA: hypothetical protein VGS07_07855 [Thermoanaerobaculia bacterium]|jgi:hypothetical protein|nr:hypothetical protein [Thermoanaerobaculia bacterium]